ncbi:MAG: peptidoglycan/LPS O-acetylase OafA/YrhL [Porticoccus sp.]|jgi:peptidoglycan/LPS O-acetylase OafA/YrhL
MYAPPCLRLYTTTEEQTARADNAYIKFQNTRHFQSLDGLRCISILAVIWHHVAGDQYPASSLFFAGHHGVTLFFIISGFLITSLLIREKRRNRTIFLGKFYIRRALRIFPVYYGVIFIYSLLVYVIERDSQYGQSFFNNLIYFITYTSNYFVSLNGDRVIFYFAWSLAAEEQFYMLWPAIEKWLSDSMAILCALLLILLSLLASNHLIPLTEQGMVTLILENIAIPICVGVLLAHAMDHQTSFKKMFHLIENKLSFVIFSLISLILICYTNELLIVSYVALALALASAIISNNHSLNRILNSRFFVEIGTVSYGIYLFHMLALNLSRKLLPSQDNFTDLILYEASLFMLTSLIAFLVAKLSFRYFESYFLALKDRTQANRNKIMT